MNFELRYKIFRTINNITYPFRKFRRMLYNFFFWGWKLRDDINRDYSSVYFILELKLKRLRTGCYQDGNHVWSEKSREYKALSECIQLCKLLQSGYQDNLNEVDMSKLGFEGNRFVNRMTKQEKTWLSIASKKDDAVQKARKERLFQVMLKWQEFWWD